MNRIWGTAGILTVAAILAATAGARVQAPSGDTCTFGGSGTQYTVNVASGAGVQQYGVAFGAPGVTITNISIPGRNGTFTTTRLASKTTGAWTSDEQMTGSFQATLTLRGKPTGPFIIVPAAAAQGSYYDAVRCTAAPAAPKTVLLKVASRATYSPKAGGWLLVVTVPVAGVVSAVQPLPPSTALQPSKSLVQTRKLGLQSRGKVTLTLKATPKGQAMLAAKKVITVNLRVAFDAEDGRAAHKTVALTLRK